MKKTNLILILILLLSGVILNSCKKDEDTPEDLLTAHPWYGVTVEKYINGQLAETDDISERKMVFYNDKTYKFYDDGDLVETGTWKIIEGSPDKIVTKDDEDGDEVEVFISELSDEMLEAYRFKQIDEVNYKYIIKYKK